MTGTTPEENDRSAASGEASAQAEIGRLRLTVLAGRGPGASRSKVLRNTRGRTSVGGRPVALEREAVAREAAAARGDAEALLLHAVTARSRLDADVVNLRHRWAERSRRPGARRILDLLARFPRLRRTATGAVLVLLASRTIWRNFRRERRLRQR